MFRRNKEEGREREEYVWKKKMTFLLANFGDDDVFWLKCVYVLGERIKTLMHAERGEKKQHRRPLMS